MLVDVYLKSVHSRVVCLTADIRERETLHPSCQLATVPRMLHQHTSISGKEPHQPPGPSVSMSNVAISDSQPPQPLNVQPVQDVRGFAPVLSCPMP
jgi:hypothetical protein